MGLVIIRDSELRPAIPSPIVALRDSILSDTASGLNAPAPNESRLEDLHHLALVFSMIDDAAILTDGDGRIMDFNPAAERLFNCRRGEQLATAPAEDRKSVV